jgi:hypothetical protein
MRYPSNNIVGLGAAFLLALSAQAPAADKSRYNLFNPTPRPEMRDLSTDRPDTTESPITVDAGHFQLEMSFVDFSRDGSARTTALAPMNLKAGLTNDIDLQLVLLPYTFSDDDADDAEGFGDTVLRLKWNLWGNDGGKTAFALMPYVLFPTGDDDLSSNYAEFGLIAPLAIELTDKLALNLMAEVDFVWDHDEDDFDAEFLHTAAISFTLTEKLGAYVEYIGVWAPEDDEDHYHPFFSAGATYALTDDIQLDAGFVLPLEGDVEDAWRVFTGVSIRF